MKNINQLGVYQIGSIKYGRLPSRYEAIHVRLRQPTEKVSLPQYVYNLDELRDLESKLVLIAGPESIERKEVDKFLDVSCMVILILLLHNRKQWSPMIRP